MKAALTANPHDAAGLRLLGLIAIDTFTSRRASRRDARQVNPNSTVADLLDARNLLQQRRPKDAEAPLQRVLSAEPQNLEALGLLAGTDAVQLLDEKTIDALARVEKIDPDNATAYLEVAEQLGARRASRAPPQVQCRHRPRSVCTAPRNGLGLLTRIRRRETLASFRTAASSTRTTSRDQLPPPARRHWLVRPR